MSRVQLALNVSDLGRAIDFDSRLFGARPAKVRPGYANFKITEPALKLVLIETSGPRGTGTASALNHMGVELEDPAAVRDAAAGLAEVGLGAGEPHEISCCYALQDKVWLDDPDGLSWELYTVLGDAETSNIDHEVPSCACTTDSPANGGATCSSGCC